MAEPGSDDENRATFDDTEADTAISFYNTLFRLTDAARQACIPAVVVAREDEYGLVRVLPIAKTMRQTKDRLVGENKEPLWVRPFKIFHGGFHIHAPLMIGDTGYIIANDRGCTTAIGKNSEPVLDDGNLEDLQNNNTNDPDNLTPQRYNYGFFLPCSWVRNNNEFWKEWFDKEDGKFKDNWVLANGKKIDDEGSCYFSVGADGEISIHSVNSSVRVGDVGMEIERKDTLDDGEYTDDEGNAKRKNSSIIRVDESGVGIGRYSGEGDEEVHNTVDVYKDRTVFSKKDLSAEIDCSKLHSPAEFRDVTIITGPAIREGDSVTIPTAKIRVLCDAPEASEPITFSVLDIA